MIKRALRQGISRWCELRGVLDREERRGAGSLAILCYHRILPKRAKDEYPFPDLAVTPEGFLAHCEVLAERYEILPLGDAVDRLRNGYRGTKPLGAITFDDGYRDNFRYALPALRQTGLRATFFVVSSLAGTTLSPWYDSLARSAGILGREGRLAEVLGTLGLPSLHEGISVPSPREIVQRAKRLSPGDRERTVMAVTKASGGDGANPETDHIMGPAELAELASLGHEIGAHSVSHEILTSLSPEALEREVSGCSQVLQSMSGKKPRGFCYPNGDYDEDTVAAVRRAGFDYACTTKDGNNSPSTPPYELRRHFICENRLSGIFGGQDPSILRRQLTGAASGFSKQKPE